MKPRNTLVTIVEITDAEKKTAAGIVVPTSSNSTYRLCEVVDVGHGVGPIGEHSATADLKPGQTVLVKVGHRGQGPAGGSVLIPLGFEFKDARGRDLKLVEETQIVGIVSEPESPVSVAG